MIIGFKSYSLISIISTVGMIFNAIQKQETFFHTVVYLTSQKINLLIFFNFILVVLINLGGFLVWVFFDHIRTIESKVSIFSLIVNKIQHSIVHSRQVSKEALSFLIVDPDIAQYIWHIQVYIVDDFVLFLGNSLASLQTQWLPDQSWFSRQNGALQVARAL